MATAAKKIVCSSCGFENRAPLANRRCVSCGARIESQRQRKREGFSVTWFGVSLAIMAVMTGALVVGLPLVVPLLDFEGSAGMLVAIPTWFLGGLLIGLISPGKTFVEPVAAVFLVAIPTALFLFMHQTVKTMPAFMYALMSAVGILFTLVGTHVGERIQMGPPAKTS
ncbi:MAG TPA: hypothetical protein VM686_18885 [Polyangiaceae bacterium]|jgi:hypothetical protein|nr:hypothetical protein [Polyangiaceae bacterium]